MNRITPIWLIIPLLVMPHLAFAQGSLNPPGPPGPTMKSLDQIGAGIDGNGTKLDQANTALAQADSKLNEINARAEKRIPVNDTNTPGDDTRHFIISQPGSYFLTGNLGATKPRGILVAAEGVTLDLNGFELRRVSGTPGTAIEILPESHRSVIRNGTVRGFFGGVTDISSRGGHFRDLSISNCTGSNLIAGLGAVVERCRVVNSGGTNGIFAGAGSIISDCTVTNNVFVGSSTGISVDEGSVVQRCVASNNTVRFAINTFGASVITHCSASNNTSASTTSCGINAQLGSVVTHCNAKGNTSTAGTLNSSTGAGITLLGGRVQHCSAAENTGSGIRVSQRNVVQDNECAGNGAASGDGAGITVTGPDNRIEGNEVTNNDRGIHVESFGNLIVKNSATGNGPTNNLNYVIVGANRYGPIVDITGGGTPPVAGSGGGSGTIAGTTGSTDPWANFSY